MPRVIQDDAGNDIEVFDKTEFESAIAEKAKVAEEALNKAKELEQEINPNWREMRKAKDQQDKEIKELRNKLQNAGVKEEATPSVSSEDLEKRVNDAYLKRYTKTILDTFGEKKEAVGKYFEKLSQGESLTEDAIDRLVQDAARAVGAQTNRSENIASRFGRQGSAPQFESSSNDEGFGATPAGKAMAAAMNLMIELPKQ